MKADRIDTADPTTLQPGQYAVLADGDLAFCAPGAQGYGLVGKADVTLNEDGTATVDYLMVHGPFHGMLINGEWLVQE